MRYTWKLRFALIALIVGLFTTFWMAFGLTKGIDLQGGSVLIYDLDLRGVPAVRRTPALTKSTIDILQRRLDSLAIKEMSIRAAGDYQIMIQLPGTSEQSKEGIKEIIQKAGQLWFKIAVPFDEKTAREIDEQKARGEYVMDENEFDTCRIDPKNTKLLEEFRNGEILVQNENAVDGKLLEEAGRDRDSYMRPAVKFRMKREGTKALAATTEKYRGKQMPIILDGVCISAPNINSPIPEGSGIIEGVFTDKEIDDLVNVLDSGALPAHPVLASENTVESTLGQEQIQHGMLSMFAAVGIVILFMFLYYYGAGMIANVALVANLVILLGVMALFEATLTLPGIAGIVLTIGMAVDANILIYERIREEKRRGVPVNEYIDAGYGHAFWAIFDTHVTTFLSGLILFYVGTGPIKGFAVTLMIGIAISFFTALYVTRAIYNFLLEREIVTEVRMNALLHKEKLDVPFLQKRMPFVIASVIMFNLGYLAFVVRGNEKYGIDFNGGTALQMRLTRALTKEEVHDRLAAITRKSEAGMLERPYEGVEASRLGPAEDARGAGRQFQLLISSSGRKRSAKETSMAPPSGVVLASSAPADVRSAAAAATGTAVEADLPQEQFIHDVERTFKEELAPRAFSERRIEPDPTSPGKGHILVEVAIAPGQALDVDATRRALAEAGILLPEVATPTAQASGVARTTIRAGPYEVAPGILDRAEQQIRGVFESPKLASALSNPFPFKSTIGSSVAESLKYRAVLAIVLSLIMVIVYLAFRFEFKMGLAAALCLFHDVLVVVGAMMLMDVTSKWTHIDAKQNLQTIAAYLTIIGYSINDTIINFDRMRENLSKWDERTSKESYLEVLNRSINETFGRTILTSFTVFLTLIVLSIASILWLPSLQGFALAMLVGTIFGTYSSIVIATPILLVKPRRLALICAAELAYFIVAAVIGGRLAL